MQSIFKQWGPLLAIHQCSAADRYGTPPPWVVFQPNTKLTKVVVKFRCCSPVTLGKNLSLINEDSGCSYWNKKQNQTYWVRELYFESQLKIQDAIIITVKKIPKNATTESHTASSLNTLKYRIFTKKAAIQNQLCKQPGNSPQTTKSNQATITVSAALQLLQADLYQKALSQKYNFCYAGEESRIFLEHIQHCYLLTSCLTVLFCLKFIQVLKCNQPPQCSAINLLNYPNQILLQ